MPTSNAFAPMLLLHLLAAEMLLLIVVVLFQDQPVAVAWTLDRRTNNYLTRQQQRTRRNPNKNLKFLPEGMGFAASSSASSTSFSASVDDGTTSTDSTTVITSESESSSVIYHSDFLGDIYKIRIGDDDDFLGANAVPTFATTPTTKTSSSRVDNNNTNPKARGLEGALQQGPAFVLDNVLSPDICEELIQTFEELQFGSYNVGKNNHGALQIVVSQEIAQRVGQRLSRHIDIDQVAERRLEMLRMAATTTTTGQQHEDDDDSESHDVRLVHVGLNRRWRVYRYAPGGDESFAPHIDAGFPPSGLTQDGSKLIWDDSESFLDHPSRSSSSTGSTTEIVSRLTVLMYLNDDFVGGETKFYQPNATITATATTGPSSVIASVKPIAGSCLVFPQGVGETAVDYARQHWPLHEGSPVVAGSHRPKYVIRSDCLFATTKEPLPLNEELFQHDHLVRQAFLPRAAAVVDNNNMLSHLSSLYNPHMGVENMGPLLYSLIRFTKKRKVVEIGAGYTSLWILQALKDNDDEIERIRHLDRQDKCKLLNIQWTNEAAMTTFDRTPASLLCIDNCEHQKETATGACAVAKSLGLDSYLEFLKGDAFDMGEYLEEATIEILWCDFGVGSRMKEFLSSGAWSSIQPGGLLLCHSTLTNQRTRDWLDAARSHKGQEITGIPADEYVELSLLEPHKHYQNSVSVFQKRKAGDNKSYSEPIFSEYA